MYLWYTTAAAAAALIPIRLPYPLMYAIFHPLKIVSVFIVIPNVEAIHCCSSELLQDIMQHENERLGEREKRNRSHQMSFTRKLYSFYNSHNFNLFCHPNGVAFRNFFNVFLCSAAVADIKPTIFHAENSIYTHSILSLFFSRQQCGNPKFIRNINFICHFVTQVTNVCERGEKINK